MAKKKVAKKILNQKKSAGKKQKSEENWPSKRNVFFRPARLNYVRKLVKQTGCVFCKSAEVPISFDSLCIYKSTHSQIVLNKYPYNNGHLLILPLMHIGNILELSPERYQDLNDTLRLAIEAIQILYQPAGFNIGMNHGISGGAGIPDHLHYHIVPRWSGDLNFFPLIAETKLVIEELATSYQKFHNYFSELQKDVRSL